MTIVLAAAAMDSVLHYSRFQAGLNNRLRHKGGLLWTCAMAFSNIWQGLASPFGTRNFINKRWDMKPIRRLLSGDRPSYEAMIRSLCKAVYVGNRTILCRILGRYKIFLDSGDVGLAPHLMLDGYWEMWVTETILSFVSEGMVVADIGANVGYFSLLMADLVGPGGHVHAFEPNPRMAELLGKSVAVNGFWHRVSVHQVALSGEGGQDMALIVPKDDPKNAHMVSAGEHLPEGAIRIPTARLDSREDWQRIEFAKVDVEGAEQLVWAGAQGLLDNGRLRTVILEFTPARYEDPRLFLEKLLAPGYSLSRIDFLRGVVPMSVEEVMASNPHEDIMLVLRR